MESLDALCAPYGFSDAVDDIDISTIEEKADEIMQHAQEEFDAFLSELNYETAKGFIVRKNTIKKFVVSILKDRLNRNVGNTFHGEELAYKLIQQYNIESYKASVWVETHFREVEYLTKEMRREGFSFVDVFRDVKGFMSCVMVYVANDLLSQCKTAQKEKLTLTTDTIHTIKKELEQV